MKLPDRCLTIAQPWVHFIFDLPEGERKNVENRTRNIGYFERFWISSSARVPLDREFEEASRCAAGAGVTRLPGWALGGSTRRAFRAYGLDVGASRFDLDLGAIIGWVECAALLKDGKVIRSPATREMSLVELIGPMAASRASRWYSGSFGYVISAVHRLEKPVPCIGKLGFWKLGGEELQRLGV